MAYSQELADQHQQEIKDRRKEELIKKLGEEGYQKYLKEEIEREERNRNKSLAEIEAFIKTDGFFKREGWGGEYTIYSTELLNILVNKILSCSKQNEPASIKVHKGYGCECDECGLRYEGNSEIISYDSHGMTGGYKNAIHKGEFLHQQITKEEITGNHLLFFKKYIETYDETKGNPTLSEIIK